jgi:hypothetical protein
MKAVRFVIAFAIAWGMQSGVSFAEKDWLDHLSGPGPFNGYFFNYRFLCVSNSKDYVNFPRAADQQPVAVTGEPKVAVTFLYPWDRTASFAALPALLAGGGRSPAVPLASATDRERAAYACKSDREVRGYFELTYRWATSTENRLVVADDNKVHLKSLDIAYVARFDRGLDMRLALGSNRFNGDAFAELKRTSVTPSIAFSPLALAGEGPRAHLLKVEAGGTLFLRGFRATEFCNRGNAKCVDPSWESNAEFVPMLRVLIDLSLAGG